MYPRGYLLERWQRAQAMDAEEVSLVLMDLRSIYVEGMYWK